MNCFLIGAQLAIWYLKCKAYDSKIANVFGEHVEKYIFENFRINSHPKKAFSINFKFSKKSRFRKLHSLWLKSHQTFTNKIIRLSQKLPLIQFSRYSSSFSKNLIYVPKSIQLKMLFISFLKTTERKKKFRNKIEFF